jgi:hypothetical protein
MDVDKNKLKYLSDKVDFLLKTDNIAEFDKMLKIELDKTFYLELPPEYLFVDHYHSTHIDYQRYHSIFTHICTSGKLDFVKSAIEKTYWNNENNYLIGTATASGFLRACESSHLDIVRYLAQTNRKYYDIIGKDDGINHRNPSEELGKIELIHDVLERGLINTLYKKDKKTNMELVEYIFLSDELDNHPTVKFHNLITIFMNDHIDLFDKVFNKSLKEGFDIREIFRESFFDSEIPNRQTVLVNLAQYLIHDLKIYEYPGMIEKISKDPILKSTYLTEELNNNLKINEDTKEKKRLRI